MVHLFHICLTLASGVRKANVNVRKEKLWYEHFSRIYIENKIVFKLGTIVVPRTPNSTPPLADNDDDHDDHNNNVQRQARSNYSLKLLPCVNVRLW